MTAHCIIQGELLDDRTAIEMSRHLHSIAGNNPAIGHKEVFSFSKWEGEYEVRKCDKFSRYPHQINAIIRRKVT